MAGTYGCRDQVSPSEILLQHSILLTVGLVIQKGLTASLNTNKSKDILVETFSPTFCIIIIGIFSGLAISLGMTLTGLVGIATLLLLFTISFKLILMWRGMRRGTLFPQTLKPIAIVLDMKFRKSGTDTQNQEERVTDDIVDDTMHDGDAIGMKLTEQEIRDMDVFTRKLFKDDCTPKVTNFQENIMYQDWYMYIEYQLQQHGTNNMTQFVQDCFAWYEANMDNDSLDRLVTYRHDKYGNKGTKERIKGAEDDTTGLERVASKQRRN